MEKISKKAKILYITIGVLITACGAALGYIAGSSYFTPSVNYQVNSDSNSFDQTLYNKYLALKNNDTPLSRYKSDFRPYELVRIALMNFEQAPYAQITNKGTVVAMGLEQVVRAKYIKQNTSYFSESLSKGTISVAWRFYQTGDEIKTFKGKLDKESVEKATYSQENVTNYNPETFKQTWGKSMISPFIYLLNDQSVLSESCEINEDTFQVDLSLHKINAVANYVKQMKETSGLSSYPVFDSVALSLTLSSDLKLMKNVINEVYDVNYIVTVSSTGNIVEEYQYEEGIEIPSLEEHALYQA